MLNVARNEDYLFIGTQILDKSALPFTPVDPDFNPVANIYHDVNGAPVVATAISGGTAVMVKQLGLTGFFGVGLPITPTTPLGRYWVRLSYEVGSVQQRELILFDVVDPGNTISKALSAVG